ncbi:MAG: hypothetical protein AAF958_20450, partial [Planctomycetota bacterium]
MAALIGLLPLVLVEVALRWIEPPAVIGLDLRPAAWDRLPPLFTPDANGKFRQTSPDRLNFFYSQRFADPKPAATRRIFVIGGSTVAGRPWAVETSLSADLQLRLESIAGSDSRADGQKIAGKDPKRFEVINVGGVSHGITRLAPIVDEVLNYQPDAIVLYTGHNEFLEDQAYRPIREASPARRQLSRWASRLAIVRAIQRQTAGGQQRRTAGGQNHPSPETNAKPAGADEATLDPNPNTFLDQSDGWQRYRRDSKTTRRVLEQFRLSLDQVVRRVQIAGVPLWLYLPASDAVRTPPLKSLPPPGNTADDQREIESLQYVAADERIAR